MRCPHCGREMPDGSTFCSGCGSRLNAGQNAPRNGTPFNNPNSGPFNTPPNNPYPSPNQPPNGPYRGPGQPQSGPAPSPNSYQRPPAPGGMPNPNPSPYTPNNLYPNNEYGPSGPNDPNNAGGKGKIILYSCLAAVAAFAIGFGAWMFFAKDDGGSSSNDSAVAETTPSTSNDDFYFSYSYDDDEELTEPSAESSSVSVETESKEPAASVHSEAASAKPDPEPEPEPVHTTTYNVLYTMKIRSTPSLSGTRVGTQNGNTQVKISETHYDGDGGTWGLIAEGKWADNWICIINADGEYLKAVY